MGISKVSQYAGWTFPAGTASLTQFQFVAINGSGQIVTPTTGQFALVLDDAPSIASATFNANTETYSGGYIVGQEYSVVIGDVPKVIFGASLAAGVPVMTNGSGQAVAATTTNYILGYTLQPQASGDYGPLLWAPSIHP